MTIKSILFHRIKFVLPALILTVLAGLLPHTADAARIKDLASIKGVRTNQLIGYGLVVGLNGTGDKSGTEFTIQSLANMLERMGVHVDKNSVKVKNVAAVMVTAKVPPFARIGSELDITLSSIGDAKSLFGGTLLMTPLKGVNGKIYAMAQGALAVGGFAAGGEAGGGVGKNNATGARIAKGATLEREIPMTLDGRDRLTLALFNPDFTTALRMAEKINKTMGEDLARALDSGTLDLQIPLSMRNEVARFIGGIETLQVRPDAVARIVVNEKTGTVVIGENVRISTVAISHGNLSISIKEALNVSQPRPFSDGATTVTPDTDVEVVEEQAKVMVMPAGATIGQLVRGLNAIGVTPRDMISIFQSLKVAGALQADIEII